ncbi:MAG: DUF5060 domain-containing protein [Bacteroidales bacterium]|nr:DUF5060 domain-containing protein [Bacteroidales bacterium]
MWKTAAAILALLVTCTLEAQITGVEVPSGKVRQYGRADFRISLTGEWSNPFLSGEAALDMVLTAPSGGQLRLPCFFISGESGSRSTWEARFTPKEKGQYRYHFEYSENGSLVSVSQEGTFRARAPRGHGMLRPGGNWILRYDDGTPFRGIGENLCWESRDNDDSRFFKALHEQHDRFNYDVMLPSLAGNGGNFCRMWMCSWNFPIDRHSGFNNSRYSPSGDYFNPSAAERLDHVLSLAEKLGIKIMLCMGPGEGAEGEEFFTSAAEKERYRNRLRYIVARWGYSPSIAMWEFFNEVDNVQFRDADNPIPPEEITAWHSEMAAFLKSIDPYSHMVTTSISHRDVPGLNDIEEIDVNQKHIYCNTSSIPGTVTDYESRHGKPYVIGEFGYEWDWSKNFDDFADGMQDDFRRGAWLGLFSPTPVTPMSWWWEWFADKGTDRSLKAVRYVSDRMLAAGKGEFSPVGASAGEKATAMAVRCGKRTYLYVWNPSGEKPVDDVTLDSPAQRRSIRKLDSGSCRFRPFGKKAISVPPGEGCIFEIR